MTKSGLLTGILLVVELGTGLACNGDIVEPAPNYLEGVVQDSLTIVPVARVNVVFVGTTIGETDSTGRYHAVIGQGLSKRAIIFAKAGYKSKEAVFPDDATQDTDIKNRYILDVRLSPIVQ